VGLNVIGDQCCKLLIADGQMDGGEVAAEDFLQACAIGITVN
jgi:hypothetical protein